MLPPAGFGLLVRSLRLGACKCAHARVRVLVCAWARVRACACVRVCLCMCAHACVCVCAHACVCVCVFAGCAHNIRRFPMASHRSLEERHLWDLHVQERDGG